MGQLQCLEVLFCMQVVSITVIVGWATRTYQLGNSELDLPKISCVMEQAFRFGVKFIDKLCLMLNSIFSYCLCGLFPHLFESLV